MIRKVTHQNAGRGPADVTLALAVARALHTPSPLPATPAPRAPEIAPAPVPQLMGLRTSADRPHRRKVPLHRLTTMRNLAVLGA